MKSYIISFFVFFFVYPAIRAFIWPCSTTDECSMVTGAECSMFGSCSCLEGYIFSEDLTRCIVKVMYGKDCEETIQCLSVSPGAKCRNNKCLCAEGYQFVSGRCRKYNSLDEPCKLDKDCFFGYDRQSVECRNGTCKCRNGYYQRFKNICRKTSYVGGVCVVNEDCQSDDLICVNFICQNQSNLFLSEVTEKITNYYELALIRKQYQKDPFQQQIGDQCTNYQQQCNGLKYSLCANGFCSCRFGYYKTDTYCSAELGEDVNSQDLCESFFDEQNNFCTCYENYFQEPGMRECRKPIAPVEGRCVSDSQCSPFGASHCRLERPRLCECKKYATYDATRQICVVFEGLGSYCDEHAPCFSLNSVCSAGNICVCKEKYLEVNGLCSPGLGAECQATEECFVEHAICDKNSDLCTCEEEYVEIGSFCLRKATFVGDYCDYDMQCQPLMGLFSICENNQCSCDAESHLKRNMCFKKKLFGDSCTTSLECFSLNDEPGMECRNSICLCQFGYLADNASKTCINQKQNSSTREYGVLTTLVSSALLAFLSTM